MYVFGIDIPATLVFLIMFVIQIVILIEIKLLSKRVV